MHTARRSAVWVFAAAVACNSAPRTTVDGNSPNLPTPIVYQDNPLFSASSLPLQAPPFDRIRDEHFLPALQEGMRLHLAEVRAIAANPEPPTFANTLEALERAGALLTRAQAVFGNLTSSHTNPTLQRIQAEVAPQLAAHADAIHLDSKLFARIRAVYAARDTLPGEQRRLAERYHTMFVRNGAELDAKAQARLRAINERSSTLTTQFEQFLLADTKASAVLVDDRQQLAGLDDSSIGAAAAAATAAGHDGKYLLTLQLPTSQGILSMLADRDTRRRVFEASNARCNRGNEHDTNQLVLELARLRAERASLLGHGNHASYVLADQMAGTPAAVQAMLSSMAGAIVAKAHGEAKELQAFLDRRGAGEVLMPWDWAYVAEQLRKERYAFDEAEVRQYFELESVLQNGMFFMARELYGIELAERKDLPVYHPDVRVFDVRDADGSVVGLFYADYHARPSKRGGAWMNNFVEQSELLGTKPVVVNVMNIQKPGAGQPTLLSFDEVVTLFHEFGHGVHGLFSKARYPLLAGTSVPRDYVEFPSQFHEDFVFDPRVLERCARHWQSGAAMPKELVAKVMAARKYGQGFASLEYVAAAILDMAWHTLPAGREVANVAAFEQAALEAGGVAFELVPPRYRSTYFAHVWPGGYSAGYYAYLWAEALAADAYAALQERGGMTRANGQQFREAVLSRGNVVEPMRQFVDYRARELDTKALLRRRGLE